MKRHNRLKKHTLGLAAALLMTAGMSQIALAGDSVYVNTSSLRYRTSAQIKDNISRAICLRSEAGARGNQRAVDDDSFEWKEVLRFIRLCDK